MTPTQFLEQCEYDESEIELMSFRLSTQALPQSSRLLAKAAVGIASDAITDQELRYNLDLVVFEACANVVRHAYPEHDPGLLCIELEVATGKFIRFRVLDWGKGFPELPVKISNPPPESESGRGLFIVSQLATDLAITREDDTTVVTITLNVREDQWIQCE